MLSYFKNLLGVVLIGWNLVSVIMVLLLGTDSIWVVSFIFSMFLASPVYVGLFPILIGEDRILNLKHRTGEISQKATTIFFIATIALGIFLFAKQIYIYLRTGIWSPLSIIDGLRYLGFKWASYPTDWKGIWDILQKFPLPLTLVAISIGAISTKLDNQN